MVLQAITCTGTDNKNKQQNKSNQHKTKHNNILPTYIHMHTNVILTYKKCIHTQPNYTNAKLKAWFRRILCHPARKGSGSILNRHTPGPTQGIQYSSKYTMKFKANNYIK